MSCGSDSPRSQLLPTFYPEWFCLGHGFLIFVFCDDSFENLISEGNPVNINHDGDCRLLPVESTHASQVYKYSPGPLHRCFDLHPRGCPMPPRVILGQLGVPRDEAYSCSGAQRLEAWSRAQGCRVGQQRPESKGTGQAVLGVLGKQKA